MEGDLNFKVEDVKEGKEYAGFAYNLTTSEYELVNITMLGAEEAYKRAVEAAESYNSIKSDSRQFDLNNVVVKQRSVKTLYSKWEEI